MIGQEAIMPGVLERSSVVVPTIGRPSLDVLLDALATAAGPRPAELVLVDDRPTGVPLEPERPGLPRAPPPPPPPRGPPRGRRRPRRGRPPPPPPKTLGWRTAHTSWIAFL